MSVPAPLPLRGDTDTVCAICKRQLSRYTCPNCNIPYCSTTCFRNSAHDQCTERFYKRELELDIRGDKKKSLEERKRMMDMLKKFEDESLDYGVEEVDSDDEDEEDGLSKRLANVDLDQASSSQIWETPSPSERASFLKYINDPSTSATLMQLAVEDRVEPWWTSSIELDPELSSRKIGDRPDLMDFPSPNLIANQSSSAAPVLIYNIVSICLSYCYVTRLTTSPLSSLRQDSDEYNEAFYALKRVSPFLFDKTSKHRYASLQEVVLDVWERLEHMTHPFFHLLLNDAIYLLRPALITTTATKTQHEHLMLLISDIHSFLGVNKPTHTQLKLKFYAAHVLSESFSADAVRYVVGEMEVEQRKHDVDDDRN